MGIFFDRINAPKADFWGFADEEEDFLFKISLTKELVFFDLFWIKLSWFNLLPSLEIDTVRLLRDFYKRMLSGNGPKSMKISFLIYFFYAGRVLSKNLSIIARSYSSGIFSFYSSSLFYYILIFFYYL